MLPYEQTFVKPPYVSARAGVALSRTRARADTILMMVPVLDDLSPALKERAVGATRVAQLRDVLVDIRTEDDERWTIVLTFLLAEPPEGMDTWPVAELWELRRVAREVVPQSIAKNLQELASERGIDVDDLPSLSWTVEFKPEHMPPLAPDDESLEFEG